MFAPLRQFRGKCTSLHRLVKPKNPNNWFIFIRKYSAKLAEVGILEAPKVKGAYETGQLFLHKVFGYRGIVLFPWETKVFDRDDQVNQGENRTLEDGKSSKQLQSKTQTYYQVLIDSRDGPYIRAQTEQVTFLGSQENKGSLYAVPGLDYVAHEDVLPYTNSEKQPIQHELFDKFLEHNSENVPPFIPKDTLHAWQQRNQVWLELSDVHRETTENIRVTVIPFYMGCRESQEALVYWWRYCIRLENLGTETTQLRERHWRIFSIKGTLETVRGRGVVGQEPVLSQSQPAFQYSSHVSLQAKTGHMWGTFKMERQNGMTFECRIPPFSLESKEDFAGSNNYSE